MRLSPISVLSATLIYASSLAAQETRETIVELEPFVVTSAHDEHAPVTLSGYGSRTALFGNTPLLDTPFTISVISLGRIEDQRAFSTAEVLKNDPAVGLAYAGSRYGYYDTFNLRGFETHNWYSYRVDGLVFANQGENPIENKESLQVLKGAAALRHGYAPPGGVINYVRKKPTPKPYYSVAVDVDTFGYMLAQVDAGGPLFDGSTGYRAVVAAEDWASFQDNSGDGHRYLGSLYLEHRVTDTLQFHLGAEYQDMKRAYVSAIPISINGMLFDELPVDHNNFQDGSYYAVETAAVFGGLTWRLSEELMLKSETSYNWFSRGDRVQGSYYSYLVNDDGSYDTFAGLSDDETRPAFSHQTHIELLTETAGVWHDIVAGYSYRHLKAEWGAFVEVYPGPSSIYDPVYYDIDFPPLPASTLNQEVIENGAFVTDMIHWSDRWMTLLGLRYGKVEAGAPSNLVEADALSPTVALIYKPTSESSVYALYTEGLESGGVAPTGTVNENEILDSRVTQQAELGVKWEISERGWAQASVFHIERPLEFVNGDNRYVQSGTQLHYGLEASALYVLAPGLRVNGGIMLLHAEQEETGNPAQNGRRPQAAAAAQANMGIEYDVDAVEGLTLIFNGYYVGERYATNVESIPLDAYFRLDAGIHYRWEMGDFFYTARLNVENVLDERYFVNGSHWSDFGGNAFYGAPVNARLSLQVQF